MVAFCFIIERPVFYFIIFAHKHVMYPGTLTTVVVLETINFCYKYNQLISCALGIYYIYTYMISIVSYSVSLFYSSSTTFLEIFFKFFLFYLKLLLLSTISRTMIIIIIIISVQIFIDLNSKMQQIIYLITKKIKKVICQNVKQFFFFAFVLLFFARSSNLCKTFKSKSIDRSVTPFFVSVS